MVFSFPFSLRRSTTRARSKKSWIRTARDRCMPSEWFKIVNFQTTLNSSKSPIQERKITISSIESSIHFSLEYFFRYDIFLMRTITRTKPSRSDAKRAIQRKMINPHETALLQPPKHTRKSDNHYTKDKFICLDISTTWLCLFFFSCQQSGNHNFKRRKTESRAWNSQIDHDVNKPL